ncbi:MAG: BatA and WFA domain-containing protein [Pirellulales bacterium]|nr:BatA and WFA domain-containing protein [Pirellulales bacterium]
MTFLNFSLLAGSALVALPIVLHLIMRQRPKRLEFPAMRFVQKQLDANRRSLRLRHLLLLLLRAGIIALLTFALARPSVKLPGAIGTQEAPVAAALVFDTAPRMEYRHENQTRIEVAQELGEWLLAQLPERSEVAAIDTRLGTAAAFSPDRGAAKDRISRLSAAANSRSLAETVEEAAKLLKTSQLARKEIYVFTDLARSAWPVEEAAAMRQQIESLGDCGVYVLDVGVADPINYGLGEPRLSAEVLSSNGSLSVDTELSCVGDPASRGVELYLLDLDGNEHKRGEQSVEAAPGEMRPVEFRLGGLEPRVHQGYMRIVGDDGLAADDTRWFTFEVKPAWRLLLAAPKPAARYALFLSQALAPEVYRRRGVARFDCQTCDLAELSTRSLGDYAAVCLLDPTPLEPAVWKKLADYASEGRGVAVFLGRNAMPTDSFNQPQAQELLPGKLLRQARRPDGELHLSPRDYQHPILAAFRGLSGSIPWESFPVFRYWELDEPKKEPKKGTVPFYAKHPSGRSGKGGLSPFSADGAAVVLHYSDGRPAMLERTIGGGRVLTMTTPVSDRPNEKPWNLLPVGEAWPFLILADQTASYLVGGGKQHFNYTAGQTAVLHLEKDQQRRAFLLISPDGMSVPHPGAIGRRELVVTTTDQVGNYRLLSGGTGEASLGFSVNYAPEQMHLRRLGEAELSGVFGPIKYRLDKTRQQIDRDVSAGRVGRELFPALILLVALFLALESLVSNRFYRE